MFAALGQTACVQHPRHVCGLAEGLGGHSHVCQDSSAGAELLGPCGSCCLGTAVSLLEPPCSC